MHDLTTTQDKLLKTPSGDVHSPFYRKLVSAGYKGHLGGMFGGGALYGAIGLAVGLLVGLPLMAYSVAAWPLIPIIAGIGVLHGVQTFSDIGTTAAIIAESAEIRERRQHLLDRYYDTPNPEERKEIQKLLDAQVEAKPPERMFHWRTLVFGALVGAAVALTIAFALPHIAPLIGIHLDKLAEFSKPMAELFMEGTRLSGMGIGALTAIGAAMGSFVGLDREYVRRFLDYSEEVMNDPDTSKQHQVAKVQEVVRLSEASQKAAPPIDLEVIENPQSIKSVEQLQPVMDAIKQQDAPRTQIQTAEILHFDRAVAPARALNA